MDARMTDVRALTLLRALPEQGQYTLRIKFLRERGPDEWVMEDKIDPVREGQTRGRSDHHYKEHTGRCPELH